MADNQPEPDSTVPIPNLPLAATLTYADNGSDRDRAQTVQQMVAETTNIGRDMRALGKPSGHPHRNQRPGRLAIEMGMRTGDPGTILI